MPYFAPNEDIVFIANKVSGYKTPVLYATYVGKEVVFENITTNEDKKNKVERFKANIKTEAYNEKSMLFVSATYEEDYLWLILTIAISVTAIIALVVVIVIIKKKKAKKE